MTGSSFADGVDAADLIMLVALAFSLLIAALLAAIVFVSNRRDRIRFDSYAEAFGDVPGVASVNVGELRFTPRRIKPEDLELVASRRFAPEEIAWVCDLKIRAEDLTPISSRRFSPAEAFPPAASGLRPAQGTARGGFRIERIARWSRSLLGSAAGKGMRGGCE